MKILTVEELTLHVKNLLESDYTLASVWVKGEISNYRRNASGHVYFTLKDKASAVKVVMFRSRAAGLLFWPENGMSVIVRGYVSVFIKGGQYQLYAEEMEPDGIGALHVAFEQLKQRLQEEGLFDSKWKKSLPRLPVRVGIVTSPTGAVLRDIVGIAKRRCPGVELLLAPASVQGENAPGEIVRAIELLNRAGTVDVIIVGRGGGSLEELWAFNTEEVARAIFNSKIPVVSAVGHETDYTIADMVADVRAPTPSAAAELVVPDKADLNGILEQINTRLKSALQNIFENRRNRLDSCLKSRFFTEPWDYLCGSRYQVLDMLEERLKRGARQLVANKESNLSVLNGRLQALNPLATLARGYSITVSLDMSRIIKNADQVRPGEKVKVLLHSGSLRCVVEEVVPKINLEVH